MLVSIIQWTMTAQVTVRVIGIQMPESSDWSKVVLTMTCLNRNKVSVSVAGVVIGPGIVWGVGIYGGLGGG